MIKGKDQIIFNILAYVLVGLFAVACLLPFYLIVTGSLTDESTIVKEGYSFFLTAKNISTEAYKLALKNPQSIIHAYGVTIFVTIIGTVLSIIMTTMTGYVLSRPDFPWRNGVSFSSFSLLFLVEDWCHGICCVHNILILIIIFIHLLFRDYFQCGT